MDLVILSKLFLNSWNMMNYYSHMLSALITVYILCMKKKHLTVTDVFTTQRIFF